jgi:hypothetical protein
MDHVNLSPERMLTITPHRSSISLDQLERLMNDIIQTVEQQSQIRERVEKGSLNGPVSTRTIMMCKDADNKPN